MVFKDYILAKTINAINHIGVDYFEYDNGKICAEVNRKKLRMETDLRKEKLYIHYKSDMKIYDGGNIKFFKKYASNSNFPISIISHEGKPVEFSMSGCVEVNPETDMDSLKDVILKFATKLHDNIQLANAQRIDIALNS